MKQFLIKPLVIVLALCIAGAPVLAMAAYWYLAPPSWDQLSLPNNPQAHTGIWHRGEADIRDLTPWVVPSTGFNKASVEAWLDSRPVPLGWKLVSSTVSPERGCSSGAFWVRRTFDLGQNHIYREIYLLFQGERTRTIAGMLLYSLRDSTLTEDPVVTMSFAAYCKTYR